MFYFPHMTYKTRTCHCQQALKLFPADVIVPIVQIVWTTTVLVSGSLYFQIYKLSSSLEFGMLALGGALLCLGIYLLTPSKEAAGIDALITARVLWLTPAQSHRQGFCCNNLVFIGVGPIPLEEADPQKSLLKASAIT